MYRQLLLCAALASAALAASAQDICFGEENGIISVEAESVNLPAANWIADTSIPGYSGAGHITYTAENRYGGPVTSEFLEYKIFSKYGGDYTMFLRASRDRSGTSLRGDEANDVWLNAPFQDRGRIWIKMFTSFEEADFEWVFQARAEIGKTFLRANLYLTPGVNLIYLSGRSTRYSPDKMQFLKKRGTRNDNAPEMRVDCSTGLSTAVAPPSPLPCADILSQVLVSLYAAEFDGKVCNFLRVQNAGLRACRAGLCTGRTDKKCNIKLTKKMRAKMSVASICS